MFGQKFLADPISEGLSFPPLSCHHSCQGGNRLVGLVYLVYLVCLVHLVDLVQPNKRDKPNKPNKLDEPHQRNADRPSVYQMHDDLIVADVGAHHARFNDLCRSAHASMIRVKLASMSRRIAFSSLNGRLAFAGQRRHGHPASASQQVTRYSRVSLQVRQGG